MLPTMTHIANGVCKGLGIYGTTSDSRERARLTNLSERGMNVRPLMATAGLNSIVTKHRKVDVYQDSQIDNVELPQFTGHFDLLEQGYRLQ